MARLTIERLSKLYGEFRALDDVSLAVDDGELVAILGASGCGKTTLLRQIAGFDKPDAGRIAIGDTVVSTPERQVPPERRRIGIVFQSYALWPHMDVAGNVAYGLDVCDWWDEGRNEGLPDARSAVAWRGSNVPAKKAGASLRLHHLTWRNPRPDVEVTALDYESRMTASAPFLVAVSAE